MQPSPNFHRYALWNPTFEVRVSDEAPTTSWWVVPPEKFTAAARAYNDRQRVLGESELTPDVRAALLDLENRQHRADSELPKKR